MSGGRGDGSRSSGSERGQRAHGEATKAGRERGDGETPTFSGRSRRADPGVLEELRPLVGEVRAQRLAGRIAEASHAFGKERYTEAVALLRPIAREVPQSSSTRELLGITLYRLGKWAEAIRELEAFASLTGAVDQHAVLADCHRARREWDRVEELWRELGAVSPSAELMDEGRIVYAGSLADRGRLSEALSVLERGWRVPKRPRMHHLKRAYALADLMERAGNLPRSRELFGWLARQDPGFFDVSDRLASLG